MKCNICIWYHKSNTFTIQQRKVNMYMKMILSKFKYPELNQLQIWCYGTCSMKKRILLLQWDHISENSVLCQVHFNHCWIFIFNHFNTLVSFIQLLLFFLGCCILCRFLSFNHFHKFLKKTKKWLIIKGFLSPFVFNLFITGKYNVLNY